MKEATGELSNLLVVCTCVAILIAFFFYTIAPKIEKNFNEETACGKAVCEGLDNDEDGFVTCVYKGEEIRCKYKG